MQGSLFGQPADDELSVRLVQAYDARRFLRQWHYSKTPSTGAFYGLFKGVELVGVATIKQLSAAMRNRGHGIRCSRRTTT
jgi:hypothetical protein